MQYFHVKTDVLVENNLADGVLHLLDKEDSKHVLVFADSHIAELPPIKNMMGKVEKSCRTIELRSIPSGEPTTAQANQITAEYRGSDIDMFIAIGGGAVMDLAKSVSALMVNECVVEDYQGTGKLFTSGVKKICVPTTAGTGCEISGAAVLINSDKAFKRGVVGPGIVPTYALLCAELSTTLPISITVGCGMDAMAHAIESYVSPKANDFTQLLSKEAFLKLYYTLPKVIEDPTNLKLREQMLIGSCIAGYAIDNASTGAAHGMSYGPGIHFHIPHGFAVGIFFIETMKVNIDRGCHTYAGLYRALNETISSGNDKKDAESFVDVIDNYEPWVKFGKTLFDYGVKKDDIDLLAEASMQNTVAYATNPVPFTLEDSYSIYKRILQIDD